MTNPDLDADAVLAEFIRRVREGEASSDLRIEVGVSGGAPRHRLIREMRLDGHGRGMTRSRDDLHDQPEGEHVIGLPADEAQRILDEAGRAAGELTVRSRHRLPPDSLVGRVLIESHGQRATFDFRVEEDAGVLVQNELDSPHVDRLVDRLIAVVREAEASEER